MTEPSRVDFYGDTQLTFARLIYRRLAKALRDTPDEREAAIASATEELTATDRVEFRKFKFFVPPLLKRFMTAEEAADLDAALAPRRAKARRLKMFFPVVSDEFSLDPEFLSAVLDLDRGPQIPPGGRFYTIGSCFANNIAVFLKAEGYNADTFQLAEDLNSPISNAFLFELLGRSPAARLELMVDWLGRIFPEMAAADRPKVAAIKLRRLDDLAARLAEADCVVMTLGNVVDFFREGAGPSEPLMDKVFPMFVAMPGADEEGRAKAAALLKKQGASLRLATTEETRQAIAACVAGIRKATKASIVVTLSPVPINAALAVGGTTARSAPEVDCVSKSRLRSALDELMPALQAEHGAVHYYPSFEIVRWIAPNLPMATFGLEDASARHVSGPILEAVCNLFVQRFVRWGEAASSPAVEAAPG